MPREKYPPVKNMANSSPSPLPPRKSFFLSQIRIHTELEGRREPFQAGEPRAHREIPSRQPELTGPCEQVYPGKSSSVQRCELCLGLSTSGCPEKTLITPMAMATLCCCSWGGGPAHCEEGGQCVPAARPGGDCGQTGFLGVAGPSRPVEMIALIRSEVAG